MSTTIKPNMTEINKIPKEFLKAWIEDLKTSVKHTAELVNEDATAFCCLGRACIVAGADVKSLYNKHSDSNESHEETTREHDKLIGIHLCDLGIGLIGDDYSITPPELNDGFYMLREIKLTHLQISQLLSGQEVVA